MGWDQVRIEQVMVVALASGIAERAAETVTAVLTVTLATVDLLMVLTVARSEVPELTVFSSLVGRRRRSVRISGHCGRHGR
jgi:hypothetical protein